MSEQEFYQICGTCGGSGEVVVGSDNEKTISTPCSKCDGEGRVLFGFLITKDDVKPKQKA
jgi:DnaJ-class molecular chaperone